MPEGKIGGPSVSDGALVQRNQLSVPGELFEETAGVAVPFENDVVSTCMIQEVSKLNASWPCTNNTITLENGQVVHCKVVDFRALSARHGKQMKLWAALVVVLLSTDFTEIPTVSLLTLAGITQPSPKKHQQRRHGKRT